MARASQAGAVVVDTEPIFSRHLMTSSLELTVGPYDAHPNGLAIRLAMKAAASALMSDR